VELSQDCLALCGAFPGWFDPLPCAELSQDSSYSIPQYFSLLAATKPPVSIASHEIDRYARAFFGFTPVWSFPGLFDSSAEHSQDGLTSCSELSQDFSSSVFQYVGGYSTARKHCASH
jgi:hypothetical protein